MKPFVFAFLLLLSACSQEDKDAIPNVRLGMAPRDVRERFTQTGTWKTGVGVGDDTVLEWNGSDEKGAFANARFEFHLGMLVAIRARSREPVTKQIVTTTPKTVTVRSPAPEGGTSVAVLARDCPTHKDEAESLVRQSLR